MLAQIAIRCSDTQRWWGEAPDLPETVRKATLLVEFMAVSAEAFAEPRPRVLRATVDDAQVEVNRSSSTCSAAAKS